MLNLTNKFSTTMWSLIEVQGSRQELDDHDIFVVGSPHFLVAGTVFGSDMGTLLAGTSIVKRKDFFCIHLFMSTTAALFTCRNSIRIVRCRCCWRTLGKRDAFGDDRLFAFARRRLASASGGWRRHAGNLKR